MSSNRYPRPSTGIPVVRPYPGVGTPYPGTFPGGANDNFPGFPPKKPGRMLSKIRLGSFGSILITGGISFAVWLGMRANHAPRGNWVVKYDCASVKGGHTWYSANFGACVDNQLIPSNPATAHKTPESLIAAQPSIAEMGLWEYYTSPAGNRRMKMDVSYQKIPTLSPGLPAPEYHRGVSIDPDIWNDPNPRPWLDPRVIPPELPYPQPRPRVRKQPGTIPGYNPEGRAPHVDPETWTTPRVKPSRPPRGTKERKVKGSRNLRMWLGWVLSTASEVGDFLDSLHDALPDSAKTEDANMAEKFKDLYGNLDKVDMNKALQNLIENQQEDRITGEQFEKFNQGLEAYGIELPSLRV